MDEQLKTNLTSPKHWVRLVYMVLFAFFVYVAAMVMIGLVVVQFLFSLLTGSDNHKLRAFGYTLTRYIQQALMFLSFNSEFKPFPFADWPEEPAIAEPVFTEATTVAPVATDTAPVSAPVADAGEPASKSESGLDEGGKNEDTQKGKPLAERPHESGSADETRDPPLVDPEAEKRILS